MKEERVLKIEGENWGKLQDEAFLKVNKKAKIDGFREGHAPRAVYEKKYGIMDILYEAADKAIDTEYRRILTEDKIIPIIEPKVDLVSLDKDKLEVKFTFITEPKIELGKYTNLGIKKDPIKVTKEEIKKHIDMLLNDYAEVSVKEGAVESGNIAIIDFVGSKDGVEFEGGKGENYSLTIGSNTFIPGFEDAIIGMKKGEEKDINLNFPEDYPSEDLKGQKVVFKVKVNEIKERTVPKLDKEFFEDLAMPNVKDKESLETQIKEELEHQKSHEIEHIYEDKCLDKAVSNMKMEVLPEMINDETEHMYHEFIERMKMQGISEEMYFEYTKSKKEDILKQMEEEATKRIKYRYLLKEVIKEEKIKVTDKEAKDRLKDMSKQYNVDEETILKEVGSLEAIKMDLTYQKALEIVTKNEEK